MKKTTLLLSGIFAALLCAEPLPNSQWKDTVIKRNTTFDGEKLILTVHGDQQTGYFHKAFPGKKGEKYQVTVKVSGNGMLDAGFFGYDANGKFLGRFPKVLPGKSLIPIRKSPSVTSWKTIPMLPPSAPICSSAKANCFCPEPASPKWINSLNRQSR